MGLIAKFFGSASGGWMIDLVVAALLLGGGFFSGCEVKGAFDAKAQLAQANAAAAQVHRQIAIAQQKGEAGQALADQAAGAFAQAETKIQTVTRTLTQRVPVQEPIFIQPNPVHGADNEPAQAQPVSMFTLSCGFVRRIDAATLGTDDTSIIPACAGQPDDSASAFTMSELENLLISNSGIAQDNREQLIHLQDFVRATQLWYADLAHRLESGK